jgi:dihydroflavonol-4-reductase
MPPPSSDADLAAYWRGKRVALTGATGFVGHHLATQLHAFGANVVGLVRDLKKAERLHAAGIGLVQGSLEDDAALCELARGCEVFFHVAGAVDFEGDWDRFRAVNVAGTRQAITAARQAGARRVVHTSSIVAVGASPTPHAIDETATWNLGSLAIPYVTTKREAEEEALSQPGEIVVVNPASVIGPDDFFESEFGTLCKRFWRGRLPFHFGGGNNYVDVRDVARGHLLAAMHGQPGQRYLLSGTNRSMSHFFSDLAQVSAKPIFRVRLPGFLAPFVAALLTKLAGKKAVRSYLTPGQAKLLPFFFYFDAGKAMRELGYAPRPWRETLHDSHAFWMTNRDKRAA